MSVEVKSNQITGITTTVNPTDAASKQYVDDNITSSGVPTPTFADQNEFLFTNGSTASWEPIQASQEYTAVGTYTFTVPTQAKKFTIEATGAGGGGASGDLIASNYVSATVWRLRTAGNTTQINASIYKSSDSSYLFGGNSGLLNYSTNAIFWTLRTSGTTGAINSLAPYFVDYIAGGASNTVMWTQRVPGFGSSAIFTLMYDGTNYFAAGVGGVLNFSTNSIHWELRTSGRTTQIGYGAGGNGLLYAPGQTEDYVYAGASGSLSSSTDSVHWTARTSPNSTIAIQALAFGSLPIATYVRANATAGNIATSTNAIQWTLRTTGNTTNVINALLYSTATTEYYVNCRAAGVLQTSTNAIEWTARTSGTAAALHQLLYGGVYVVSGASGVINTSTNAIEWTLRTSGTAQALYGLAYNASFTEKYIAAGVSGAFLSSTDAITWTLRTSLFQSSQIQAVTSGSIFVAGGVVGTNSGTSGASTTVTWTGNTPTGTATYTLTSAAGTGAADSTTAGAAGAAAASTLNPLYTTAGLAGGAGLSAAGASNNSTQANSGQVTGGGSGAFAFNIGGNIGGSGLTYYYGNSYTNGGSETGGNGNDGIPGSYTGNIGGGGGGGGSINDGVHNWITRTSGFGTSEISTLMYDGTNYFAAGSGGVLTTSTNGIQWSNRTSGTTETIGSSGYGLLYASGQTEPYVYSGGSSVAILATSTNSISWTLRTSPNSTTPIEALAFGSLPEPTYVRSNSLARNIATSTNGIQWTLRTTGGGASSISSLLYSTATTEYYTAGRISNGGLDTSTDAIHWTQRIVPTSGTFNTLVYGGVYVVAGFNFTGNTSIIATSTNQIEWTLRTAGFTNQSINSISYTSNNYVLVTNDLSSGIPTLATSTDAIIWTVRTSIFTTGLSISASVYGNNIFLIGGSSGILQSASSILQLAAGNGGNGTRGGGGGGGGYASTTRAFGLGGDGGAGYVRITWW